jgi:hypothetical protein
MIKNMNAFNPDLVQFLNRASQFAQRNNWYADAHLPANDRRGLVDLFIERGRELELVKYAQSMLDRNVPPDSGSSQLTNPAHAGDRGDHAVSYTTPRDTIQGRRSRNGESLALAPAFFGGRAGF